MARISSFSSISQPGLLGRLGYRVSSLLGSDQPDQQPDEAQAGLLGVPSRRQAAFSAIGSLMQGAGVGLATGDWGRAIEASNAATEQDQQRRILGYRMQQDAADRQWRNEQRAHERKSWASEEDQQNQVNSLLGNLTGPEKLYAEMDPKGYLATKFGPGEMKVVGDAIFNTKTGAWSQAPNSGGGGWRPATAQEKQQFGMPADAPLVFGPKGEPKVISTGAPSVNVSIPPLGQEPPDGNLRKELGTKEADVWKGYMEGSDTAGGLMQDLQVVDELSKYAPQGPLQGRAAEMFPGFSSAGDAYQSVVTRIAPSLRRPGSGSTSDIEYEGFLKSLPRLRGTPEGNAAISGVLQAKASLDIERGDIVRRYLNNEISAVDARKQVMALNRRSILTSGVKNLLGATGGKSPAEMTDEELLNQINGGNP